eukprot:CAMPEP_0179250108 /NCGR_PEP_ID=MMETSP0797-20121207/20993_1 /TAXON_ID=47934 /ORGANISM="Dinophysis acuminata, Strain DAEP01" /LENGTH=425 /DNA_ID=CAMNT_0020957825 /DNA_START=1 /DNA_END=1274 /DNA_ORIENTATION=+
MRVAPHLARRATTSKLQPLAEFRPRTAALAAPHWMPRKRARRPCTMRVSSSLEPRQSKIGRARLECQQAACQQSGQAVPAELRSGTGDGGGAAVVVALRGGGGVVLVPLRGSGGVVLVVLVPFRGGAASSVRAGIGQCGSVGASGVAPVADAAHIVARGGPDERRIRAHHLAVDLAAGRRRDAERELEVGEDAALFVAPAKVELLVLEARARHVRAGAAAGAPRHVEAAAHLQAHLLVEDAARPGLAAGEGRRPNGKRPFRQVAAPFVAEVVQELLVVRADVAVVPVHRRASVGPVSVEPCQPHRRGVRHVAALHRLHIVDLLPDPRSQMRALLLHRGEEGLEVGVPHDVRDARLVQAQGGPHGAPGGRGSPAPRVQSGRGEQAGEPQRADEAARGQAPAEGAARPPGVAAVLAEDRSRVRVGHR